MPGNPPRTTPRRRATLGDMLRPGDGSEERLRRAFGGPPGVDLRVGPVEMEPVEDPWLTITSARNPAGEEPFYIAPSEEFQDERLAEDYRHDARAPQVEERLQDVSELDRIYRENLPGQHGFGTEGAPPSMEDFEAGVDYRAGNELNDPRRTVAQAESLRAADLERQIAALEQSAARPRSGAATESTQLPQLRRELDIIRAREAERASPGSSLGAQLGRNAAGLDAVRGEAARGVGRPGVASVIDQPYQPPPGVVPEPSLAARRGGAGGVRPRGPGAGMTRGDVPGLVDQYMGTADMGQLSGQPGQGGAPAGPRGPSLADRENALIDQGEGLAVRRAQLAGDAAAEQVRAADDAMRERRRIQSERDQALTAARGRYDRAVAEASSMRVDPSRWYSDRGIAGGIAAAIAMALGSFAEAMGAGPNRAAEMIGESVRNDIEAQRMNASIAQQGAEMQRSAYWMARNQFEDADAAQAAAEALMLQRIEADVMRRAAEIGTDEARTNAESLRVELERQRQLAAQRAMEAQAERELEAIQVMSRAEYDMARAGDLRARTARRGAGGGARRGRPLTLQQMQAADEYYRRVERQHGPQVAALATQEAYGLDASLTGGNVMTQQQRDGQAQFSAALGGLVDSLPENPNDDIPGVGASDFVPGILLSQEGGNIRQRIRDVVGAAVLARSGRAATDAEREQITQMILGERHRDEDLRNGLGMLQAWVDAAESGRIVRPGSREAALDAAIGFSPGESQGGE